MKKKYWWLIAGSIFVGGFSVWFYSHRSTPSKAIEHTRAQSDSAITSKQNTLKRLKVFQDSIENQNRIKEQQYAINKRTQDSIKKIDDSICSRYTLINIANEHARRIDSCIKALSIEKKNPCQGLQPSAMIYVNKVIFCQHTQKQRKTKNSRWRTVCNKGQFPNI